MTSARPFLILGAAMLVGVIILLGMPIAAEAILPVLSGGAEPSVAMAETVFMLAIFLAFGLAGWLGAGLTGLRPFALGARPGPQLATGLAIGFGGVGLAAAHGYLAGILGTGPQAMTSASLFLLGTVLVLIQITAEEVYFRGWLQPALVKSWGPAAGVGVTALSFAALHLMGGPMHIVSFVNLCLGGIMFGLLALRSGGLAAALGAHFAWNWSEAMVIGLTPNPGVSTFGSLVDLELTGATLWGGSAEGLNASLGMTAVLLAILVLLTASGRRAPRPLGPAAA